MPAKKDYYAILGVPTTASPEEIQREYRKLAKRYHPDGKPPEEIPRLEEKFKDVSEAYGVLKDPDKKREYDRLRNAQPTDIFQEVFKEAFRQQKERARTAGTGTTRTSRTNRRPSNGSPNFGFDFEFIFTQRPQGTARPSGHSADYQQTASQHTARQHTAQQQARPRPTPARVDSLPSIILGILAAVFMFIHPGILSFLLGFIVVPIAVQLLNRIRISYRFFVFPFILSILCRAIGMFLGLHIGALLFLLLMLASAIVAVMSIDHAIS